MMKTQRSDTEKNNMIEEGKRMVVNEFIRQNISKPQVQNNAILLFKV